MSTSDPIVISFCCAYSPCRFQGELSPFSAHNLGSHAIGAALERAKLSPIRIDEAFMGCDAPRPARARLPPARPPAVRSCRTAPVQPLSPRCAAPA